MRDIKKIKTLLRLCIVNIARATGMIYRKLGFNSKRFNKLRQFANIHNSKRCFIICTGPSLTIEDLDKLHEKNEICIGVNSVVKLFDKTKWRPAYYVFGRAPVLNYQETVVEAIKKNEITTAFSLYAVNHLEYFKQYDTALVNATHFICALTPYKKEGAYNDIDLFEKVYKFSNNMYIGAYAAAGITNTALQVAAYMGFKEIYLLGCDHDTSAGHHPGVEYLQDETKLKEWKQKWSTMENATVGYKKAREFADKHDFKIYNATRGGKLEIFERADFDSLFSNGSKQ